MKYLILENYPKLLIWCHFIVGLIFKEAKILEWNQYPQFWVYVLYDFEILCLASSIVKSVSDMLSGKLAPMNNL